MQQEAHQEAWYTVAPNRQGEDQRKHLILWGALLDPHLGGMIRKGEKIHWG
jgi:hypothetical protein